MSFQKQLASFSAKTIAKTQNIIRYSAFDLFASVVYDTPVDKGVLRNNWFAQVGTPSVETTGRAAPVGKATADRIKAVINGAQLDDAVWLTNNMPYAVPIEFDGHSAKAAEGMVRINTVRWQAIVDANVRKFNK